MTYARTATRLTSKPTAAARPAAILYGPSDDKFTVADVLMFADSLRAHDVPPETQVSYMPAGRFGEGIRYLSVSVDADTGAPR